jgi:hypothetical protein
VQTPLQQDAFQSDVQLISLGNFNSTTNHSYAVPEISSHS